MTPRSEAPLSDGPAVKARKGTTLVEILLFIAIFGMVASAVIPLLFSATENHLLQQTAALVEQNGVQVLQAVNYRIRTAERILAPPAGASATVLALQTNSGATNPTIIGIQSGAIVMIRGIMRDALTSTQVAVEDFTVRNTSASPSRQSFAVSFRVSRTIRLQAPHTYERSFEALFTLPLTDRPAGGRCGCMTPTCTNGASYTWEVCPEDECLQVSTFLQCGSASSSP